MRSLEYLRHLSRILSGQGIEDESMESELIVKTVLNIDTVALYRDNPEIREEEIQKINEIVKRRSKREPLQYILGYTEFLGMRIRTGQGVLIPRPETEFMTEYAINALGTMYSESSGMKVLDLCTGSGCIALSIAKAFNSSHVYGTDVSGITIEYANANAELNGIENATFLMGDLYSPIPDGLKFDLIISNPPYIRTEEIDDLQPEVSLWEPRSALDGKSDGLFYYRGIISGATGFINNSGMIILEIGEDQADDVSELMSLAGFTGIDVIHDLGGRKRIVSGRWIR